METNTTQAGTSGERTAWLLLTGLLSTAVLAAAAPTAPPPGAAAGLWIVQDLDVSAARRDVTAVGARAEQELAIIGGVSARLTTAQLERLRARSRVRLYADSAPSSVPVR